MKTKKKMKVRAIANSIDARLCTHFQGVRRRRIDKKLPTYHFFVDTPRKTLCLFVSDSHSFTPRTSGNLRPIDHFLRDEESYGERPDVSICSPEDGQLQAGEFDISDWQAGVNAFVALAEKMEAVKICHRCKNPLANDERGLCTKCKEEEKILRKLKKQELEFNEQVKAIADKIEHILSDCVTYERYDSWGTHSHYFFVDTPDGTISLRVSTHAKPPDAYRDKLPNVRINPLEPYHRKGDFPLEEWRTALEVYLLAIVESIERNKDEEDTDYADAAAG